MESAALVAPLTHHPFVSKSQAPSGWNLLQQVAPLTHLAPVTHHRTVVGTCHWWVTGRRPNSLEYQICTAPEPFDTLVTGLGGGGGGAHCSNKRHSWSWSGGEGETVSADLLAGIDSPVKSNTIEVLERVEPDLGHEVIMVLSQAQCSRCPT